MQILIIATTIVASVILIISLYAFWVTYKVNKLEKEDLSLSNKFSQDHLKQFSVLLIISILLSIGDAVGYALLIELYNVTLSQFIFPLIALFISVYPFLFFFTGCLVAKRENKKHKENKLDKVKITENLEQSQSTVQSDTPAKADTLKEEETDISDINESEVATLNDSSENIKPHFSDCIPAETSNQDDLYETAEAFPNVRQFSFGDPLDRVADKKPCAAPAKVADNIAVVPSLNNEIAQYIQQMEEIEKKREAQLAESLKAEEQKVKEYRAAIEQKKKQEDECYLYFKENSKRLVQKYSRAVINFIEKLELEGFRPFIGMFNDSETPISSILINPYSATKSAILLQAIRHDGLEFTESVNKESNKKIQELTVFFINGLKKRIHDNNECENEYSLPILLYAIVRNNVIKYYHDKYIPKYGYQNLEDFCQQISTAYGASKIFNAVTGIKNITENTLNLATFYYVYYYIYENDISLSFVKTYHKVCEEIKRLRIVQSEQNLEDELFGKPKKNIITNKNVKINVSPIEKVDSMTGEQFELFMTQYFSEHGFKTTHTPLSGDYGIDLIIENDFGKIGVQLKCYSKKVPQDAIREVVAGLRHYGLNSGMVVTNNYFQPSAIKLAADNNIMLWDRNKLIEKLDEL